MYNFLNIILPQFFSERGYSIRRYSIKVPLFTSLTDAVFQVLIKDKTLKYPENGS